MTPYSDLVRSLPGLRGYWRLGESTAPFADTSGLSPPAPAAFQGSGTAIATGVPGALPVGDDDGAVLMANNGVYLHVDEVTGLGLRRFNLNGIDNTVALWIKPTASAAAENAGVIGTWADGGFSGFGWEMFLSYPSLTVSFSRYNGSDFTTVTGPALAAGVWAFVVFTYSTTAGHKLYVDGALVAANATTDPISLPTFNDGFWMGTEGVNGKQYKGAMDEVGVWGAALTGPQISSLFVRPRVVYFSDFDVAGEPDHAGAVEDPYVALAHPSLAVAMGEMGGDVFPTADVGSGGRWNGSADPGASIALNPAHDKLVCTLPAGNADLFSEVEVQYERSDYSPGVQNVRARMVGWPDGYAATVGFEIQGVSIGDFSRDPPTVRLNFNSGDLAGFGGQAQFTIRAADPTGLALTASLPVGYPVGDPTDFSIYPTFTGSWPIAQDTHYLIRFTPTEATGTWKAELSDDDGATWTTLAETPVATDGPARSNYPVFPDFQMFGHDAADDGWRVLLDWIPGPGGGGGGGGGGEPVVATFMLASEEQLSRLPFELAQRVLMTSPGPDKRSARVTWHGQGWDAERGSFAVVRSGGPLADLVGKRVQVSAAGGRRSVVAFVHREADVFNADISLSRRTFAAIYGLAIGDAALAAVTVLTEPDA